MKMPRTAAHAIPAPNLAVIQGQRTSSPEPMANPTMTAPGPVIFQKLFSRVGRSFSSRGAMGSLIELLASFRGQPPVSKFR